MSGRAPGRLAALPDPVPDDALRRNFAWRYYYSGEFPFSCAAARHVRHHRIEWAVHLLRAVGGPASRRLLVDVGCGPGEAAVLVARALGGFERVVGFDVDATFGPLLRALAGGNGGTARYVSGSAPALPVRGGAASLVISLELLEHLPARRGVLEEAARVLEPGGLLLASTPNPAGLHSLLKWPYARVRGFAAMNRAYRRAGDFYERFVPLQEVVGAARAAGLETLAAARGGHVFTFAPDALLPLNRAVEGLFERRGWLARLAVTTFVVARKPVGA